MKRFMLVFSVAILSSSLNGMTALKKKSPTQVRIEKNGADDQYTRRPGLLSGSESISEDAEEQPRFDDEIIDLKTPKKKGSGRKDRQVRLKKGQKRSLKTVGPKQIKVAPLEEIAGENPQARDESALYDPCIAGIGRDLIDRMSDAEIELSPRQEQKSSKFIALLRKLSK